MLFVCYLLFFMRECNFDCPGNNNILPYYHPKLLEQGEAHLTRRTFLDLFLSKLLEHFEQWWPGMKRHHTRTTTTFVFYTISERALMNGRSLTLTSFYSRCRPSSLFSCLVLFAASSLFVHHFLEVATIAVRIPTQQANRR
jgi:hypothetical protein